jgi:hypothetical protein
MNQFVSRLGFWSSTIIVLLVALIDAGMILSTVLFPMTTIGNIEAYASSFNSLQMLPFVPSMVLAPIFVVFMLCLHYHAPDDKKVLSQIGFSFAIVCAAVLSVHYYIQLTFVQQGLLNNDLSGLWQFAAPNPHSFFWTFAALGYGFMGIALLSVAPIFRGKFERAIKWLFVANGIIGLAFLVGNALSIFVVNILASFIWGVLFPIAVALVAKNFHQSHASAPKMAHEELPSM